MKDDQTTCKGKKQVKKPGPERGAMRKAAESAGMSRHQMYQSIAVSNIPEDQFDELVERDDPPTVTDLARIGRGKRKKKKITRKELQQQIDKKDLAIKALVMWITSGLSSALDDTFSVEELQEIHQSTSDPALQDKTIDQIVRDALFDTEHTTKPVKL